MDERVTRVSVVMATYNGGRFLLEQLASLEAQTRPPDELIVSDDGSTDTTIDILNHFSANAPFPVLIRRNHVRLGYGENFLSACDLATGDFIAFCDQDDIWRRDKLERALNTLTRTSAAIFIHAAMLIDESGAPIRLFRQHIIQPAVLKPLHLHPWGVFYGFSMVFNRDVLEAIPRAQRGAHTWEHAASLSHDLWIYFLAQSLFDTAVDPAPLVGYRQHDGNTTPRLINFSLKRLTSSLGKAVDPDLSRAKIAADRSAALAGLALQTPNASVAARAHAASIYWRAIANAEQRREPIYAGVKYRRASRWLHAVVSRNYRSLGWKLALKDLLAGVAGIRRG